MKKNLLFAVLAALMTLGSCVDPIKDPENDGLSKSQQEVNDLMSRIGTFPEVTPSMTKTLISEEIGPVMDYQAPLADVSYEAKSVTTTTEYNIVSNPTEFIVLDPWAGIWPGALLQGKTMKGNNVPANVPVNPAKRIPRNIHINMITGASDKEYYKESEMSASAVTQTMNDLLAQHLSDGMPANTEYNIEIVKNIEQLAMGMNLNLDVWGAKLNAEFGMNMSDEKNYCAVKLTQKYYTMAVDDIWGVEGAFTKDITTYDLQNYTDNNNPMCYVQSATYGRMFLMLYESSSNADSLKASLGFTYNDNTGKINAGYKKIMENSKCSFLQIGGDPVAGLEAATFQDKELLQKFIIDGAKPSLQSPGAMISYNVKHLLDNTQVKVANTFSYTISEQTFPATSIQRNVMIDLFDLVVTSRPTKKHYSISPNYAKFNITDISISIIGEEEGDKLTYSPKNGSYTKEEINLGIKTTIPVYYNKFLQRARTTDRIKITLKGHLSHSTYYNGRVQGSRDVVITQEFEYDESANIWVMVDDRENTLDKFKTITHREDFANMETEIKFNYRFKSDGMIYPLN